jgi:hypothetical protein
MALSLVAPWAALGALFHSAAFMGSFHGDAARAGEFTPGSFAAFVLPMFQWWLWPLALAGVAHSLIDRRPGSDALLAWLGAYYAFLLVAHAEVYYVLPLIPVHAVLAARALDAALGRLSSQLGGGRLRSAAFALAVVLAAGASLADAHAFLSANKYGRSAVRQAGALIADMPRVRLVLAARYDPPYAYYLERPGLGESRDPSMLGPVLARGDEAACLIGVTAARQASRGLGLRLDPAGQAILDACRAHEVERFIISNAPIVTGTGVLPRPSLLLVRARPGPARPNPI